MTFCTQRVRTVDHREIGRGEEFPVASATGTRIMDRNLNHRPFRIHKDLRTAAQPFQVPMMTRALHRHRPLHRYVLTSVRPGDSHCSVAGCDHDATTASSKPRSEPGSPTRPPMSSWPRLGPAARDTPGFEQGEVLCVSLGRALGLAPAGVQVEQERVEPLDPMKRVVEHGPVGELPFEGLPGTPGTSVLHTHACGERYEPPLTFPEVDASCRSCGSGPQPTI